MKKVFARLLAFIAVVLMSVAMVSCGHVDEPGGGSNNGGGNNSSSNNSSSNGDSGNEDKKLEMEAVDMGLPSGLLWGTEPITVDYRYTTHTYSRRSDFAWGRVSPQDSYSKNYYLKDDIENISGNIKYDAATKLCGDGWRIPTVEEWEELNENCLQSAEYHSSLTLISKTNGNTLVLPTTGILCDQGKTNKGSCWYWSATSVDRKTAYAFVFCQGIHVTESRGVVSLEKGYGIGIIPVRDPD